MRYALDLPAVYQVVPIIEAPAISAVMNRKDTDQLPYPPGYAVEVIDLAYLGAEPTVNAPAASHLGAKAPRWVRWAFSNRSAGAA